MLVSDRCCVVAGKWCPRREWSSASDARVASDAARRGVLYSSVFLGSPGRSCDSTRFFHRQTEKKPRPLNYVCTVVVRWCRETSTRFCASKRTRKTTIRDPQNYFCLFIIALSCCLLLLPVGPPITPPSNRHSVLRSPRPGVGIRSGPERDGEPFGHHGNRATFPPRGHGNVHASVASPWWRVASEWRTRCVQTEPTNRCPDTIIIRAGAGQLGLFFGDYASNA